MTRKLLDSFDGEFFTALLKLSEDPELLNFYKSSPILFLGLSSIFSSLLFWSDENKMLISF